MAIFLGQTTLKSQRRDKRHARKAERTARTKIKQIEAAKRKPG